MRYDDASHVPMLVPDPVIEAYMKDVDRTLLRENLKLTPEQRLEKFEQFMQFVCELTEPGDEVRGRRTRELA
jgi:hypothetical protein